MKQKVLFIEDQQDLGNVVKQYLEIMEFEVNWQTTGKKAYEIFKKQPDAFDILLIDIQLPEMDGFELAEHIIDINDKVPFLFLTARNEKKDRLRGLKIGADDYISKPFDIDELILRIKNITRRNSSKNVPQQNQSQDLSCGDVVLHKELLQISIDGKTNKTLTLREAQLLEYLCLNSNKILKREDILLQLWGENDYFLGRSLDVFISRLRKHLSASRKVSIENVYGIGFIFHVN